MTAGRPEIKLSPKKIEKLAAQGLSEQQIADSLGIHWATLADRKRKYTEFSEALARGKAAGLQKVTNAVFESALEGNFPAQKFYLTNRDNERWKDKTDVANTHTGADGGPIDHKWTFELVKPANQTERER